MSHIKFQEVDLCFKTFRPKKIKDILIPGSKRFSEFESDGSVHALKSLNLNVREGERVSIIGHNGAGKSTLLKTISGIYFPTSGSVDVQGRISGMFELATGFEMEMNGWDNMYLRGLMLGEHPRDIKAKMQEIAEFSELGNFLNMPVKYYSSGMFVRLAFSISTAIKPDILLLDEVVAAGDASFLEKAKKRMKEMMNSAKIIVLVTHSMQTATESSDRCLWMERGKLLMDGDVHTVTREYLDNMQKEER
ncbi:MAG: ABC transporter ATP-binding protein [Peptostreptococcaceae bacterium]|nr:ABC transporter ATP-binding protein [Peptostreptococcaceae bacterium]